MNSKPEWRWPMLAAGVAGLSGCLLGPWNMEVNSQVAQVIPQVSCMLVAGHPFDSLWLERPLAFDQVFDSSVSFVDTSATRIFVTRAEAPAETVFYRMSSANTRVWKSDSTLHDTVRMASHYTFHAFLRWNAAPEFPVAAAMREDTLTADAYVQSHYAVKRPMVAPLEALHPSLSVGLPAVTVQKALGDTAGYLASLYDSLGAIKSLAAVGVTRADFLQYLRGYLVARPLGDGDSAYYVFDPSFVPNPVAAAGGSIPRYSRSLKFAQDFDPRDYGGLVLVSGWDTTRARIYNPVQKQLNQSLGRTHPDSAGLYQPGRTRVIGIAAKTTPGNPAYPDTISVSNLALGYTGRNTFYFYAVDSAYASAHLRDAGPIPGLGGGDGGGGGNNGVVAHSNVRGGGGYFAAAALDSFSVNVMALSPDTFSVEALHQVWLRRKDKNQGN